MGNRELKELTCTTHGHELRLGNAGGLRGQGMGGQRRKNWENCNSIINKKYFKNFTILGYSSRKNVSICCEQLYTNILDNLDKIDELL